MEEPELVISTINFTDLSPSPIGRITLITTLNNCLGVFPRRPLRVYPAYALVLITRGEGFYEDESGLEAEIHTGDAILVFPGLAHTYRPYPGTRWDEIGAIFDGPAFDSWRSIGVLNSSQPIIKPPHNVNIMRRLMEIGGMNVAGIGHEEADSSVQRSLQVCAMLALLCEIASPHQPRVQSSPSRWASRACSLLAQIGPEGPTLEQAAKAMDVSIATFRRRFFAEVGSQPALWRARRRMEAACHLMQYSNLTFAQMAEEVGYADEYHFSKRFKQIIGVSPSTYRNQIKQNL